MTCAVLYALFLSVWPMEEKHQRQPAGYYRYRGGRVAACHPAVNTDNIFLTFLPTCEHEYVPTYMATGTYFISPSAAGLLRPHVWDDRASAAEISDLRHRDGQQGRCGWEKVYSLELLGAVWNHHLQ